MRFSVLGALGAVAVLVAACSDSSAAARVGGDRMVLEVGGAHASLRGALTAAGITPEAPRTVRTPAGEPTGEPATPVLPGGGDTPRPGEQHGDPIRGAEPAPAPQAQPASEPDHIVVTLGERQTLIHLAKKHLGDANRFREILSLNGWTEADSRRLLPGQKVKIPRPPARPSRR